ncbi:Imm49 family immunity protein [Natronobeatus ordinarius]|uniref:Imm49 family immunity protein n=1 Tax=Natronobeatus ordinarius TaxID=2963433 RepID=UPI0020CC1C98|nr:Imm49 family immunity protein [Natronobeatus ordinarius]
MYDTLEEEAGPQFLEDRGLEVEYLDELPDDHPEYFGALWHALTGIVDRDEQAFEDGIAQFLEWHDDNVDFENKTSADDLVCLPVLTLVVLARRDGMDVSVDSPYVPDCVDDLV